MEVGIIILKCLIVFEGLNKVVELIDVVVRWDDVGVIYYILEYIVWGFLFYRYNVVVYVVSSLVEFYILSV